MNLSHFIPKGIKRVLKRVYYFRYWEKRKREYANKKNITEGREYAFMEKLKTGLDTIPIFIISYNRLSYMENIYRWLKDYKIKNKVIIIDNHSSYEPLLSWYKTIDWEVVYLDRNYGHMAFWNSHRFDDYRKDFYIVTDPDIEPVNNCPSNFIQIWFDLLLKYPGIKKAGFSLKIDDLPDTALKGTIIDHEKNYYLRYIPSDRAYVAEIDTTMALYVPDHLDRSKSFLSAMRSGEPYAAKHLPWYKSLEMVTEEDLFYESTKKNGWWNIVDEKVHKGN